VHSTGPGGYVSTGFLIRPAVDEPVRELVRYGCVGPWGEGCPVNNLEVAEDGGEAAMAVLD
jgi:hypothetical protein